ncbi:MAG: hypothetical protein RPT95_02585, partial [Candidatus Sedimenticola sp. (ex Thyasira tokunagai)]
HTLGWLPRPILIPARLLEAVVVLVGARALAQRRCSLLQVDIFKSERAIGWVPQVKPDEAQRETSRHFLESQLS